MDPFIYANKIYFFNFFTASVPDWFQKIDANANGFIELLELDSV
jgi:hypothetical protein